MNHETMTVKLSDMYKHFTESVFDIFKDSDDVDFLRHHLDDIENIQNGRVKEIRKLFADGFTFMLVTNFKEHIHELRVIDDYNDGKLLMVLVGDEIIY